MLVAELSLRPARRPEGDGRQAATAVTIPGSGLQVVYAPDLDGHPDPGEVVWTWIPYEDDPAQGKDRPAIVIGVDGATSSWCR